MLENVHPAWKVCAGIAIFVMITLAYAGQVLLTQQQGIDKNEMMLGDIQTMLNGIREQQTRGEERAYIARAISGCADIINDGEIEITEECIDPRVAKYYPPSICEKLAALEIPGCGSEAVVIID
jgi:hypothetical protein